MAKIIAIANQKGGVGKTTTSINLSACLTEKEKKVLVIDCDPQGNTSSGLGVDKNSLKCSFYDLLLGNATFEQVKINLDYFENLHILPSNIELSGAEIELINKENREYLLKNILDSVKNNYDFILIDCPPSLNMLTLNALTAANTILVPLQCEYYALEGLSQLLYTINLVQQNLNPSLKIEGVVFTMFDSRTNLSLQVVEEVKQHLNENVYKSIIPRNVRLSEAPSHGKPINIYDKKSKGAEAYRLLAEEVILNREG